MIISPAFAMHVGLRVLREGDHFEKSLPRRVTDQHDKLPRLRLEVSVGRASACPAKRRRRKPRASNGSAFPIARPKVPSADAKQKKRWFRQGQKWRTGCEGRISVVKRRHGLNRCRYKGDAGMKRWVGLGVIADNLINIGRAMAKQSVP